MLPIVVMHLETTNLSSYESHLYKHDERTISFHDDASIVHQLTLELNHFFTQIVMNP